jgi:peptidoglycan/xylan/chitin deacetylase (PgdA/CDA1 family)
MLVAATFPFNQPIGPEPVAAAAARTVVTIQFDDGTADAFDALAILQAHGMRATFYVNSGLIGTTGHMSWDQLQSLAQAGNEIAGHTLTHENLRGLSPAEARRQVCDDRASLFAHGFQPTSFAYPFGRFDDGVKQIVRDCGYNSARWVAGVDGRSTFAETIPPRDAYATRTPQLPKSSTSLATLKSYVTDAEQHGGGWVQLVFHHLCTRCNTYARSLSPTSRRWSTGSSRGRRGGRSC